MRRRIADEAAGGQIDCGTARRIAEENLIAYSEIGRIADELNIRIRNCQLGCF